MSISYTPFRYLALAAVVALSACATPGTSHQDHAGGADKSMGMGMGIGMGGMSMAGMAMASLTPTQGNNVRGMVMFHEKDGHVMVHAKVSGLKPNAEHGFHLHEKGDCASVDGTSAGGHFNPDGKPHGPQAAAHHAGDMPALKADANGVADQKFMLHGPTVAAGPASINGRSVIVHIGPDDYATQPTGNSGARIACGVIAAH
ncbi:superoxide dismutase family protein [Roseateles oligotrophus]|uniref:Superoxide dismutase [Cu-Zn] n=1 Tax=Roseateles oligotrophus TaxID=1769250 RepID=A0ABT2YGG9_9BURK|nr:superoxide dismutase family protein [Roseateles oligotrophus]MCV2369141.1 superoxide dismutase family protein [Roseateles oligotrophus]